MLDLGVPFRLIGQAVAVESQAHNGLLRWLDNFESVTVCAPVVPAQFVDTSTVWAPADDLLASGRVAFNTLPWGYDLRSHITHVGAVRAKFRELIPQHKYLCFSNLGWLGAWGGIGAETAYELQRPYSVWLDWVLHEMPVTRDSNPIKRAWRLLQRGMLKRNSIRDIRRASLGLFHGRTVYDGYIGLSKMSEIVHDVHLKATDIIPVDQLKIRLQRTQEPLQIIYVGRVHEMKGPWHWLDAMQKLIANWTGPRNIQATWYGDGPLLPELLKEVEIRRLGDSVHFAGPEMNREKLLHLLRDADVFAFCHMTPESPRCLIEALMSGLPIFGFASSYAMDLLDGKTAGEFVPIADVDSLARLLGECLKSPARLHDMSLAALAAGRNYSDDAVFEHRSRLIKSNLQSR